jgi:hypothetical protein
MICRPIRGLKPCEYRRFTTGTLHVRLVWKPNAQLQNWRIGLVLAEINSCNLFRKVGSRRRSQHNAGLFPEFDNVLK